MFAALIAITFIGTGPAPDTILESLQNSYKELGELRGANEYPPPALFVPNVR